MTTLPAHQEYLPTAPLSDDSYRDAVDYFETAIAESLISDGTYSFKHASESPIQPKDISDWICQSEELYARQTAMMMTGNAFELVKMRSEIWNTAINEMASHWAVEEACAATEG